MGALKAGSRNFVHIVVTGLRTKAQAAKIKTEVRKLAKALGGRVSTRRRPKSHGD